MAQEFQRRVPVPTKAAHNHLELQTPGRSNTSGLFRYPYSRNPHTDIHKLKIIKIPRCGSTYL